MISRRKPVIPYTLLATSLWRELARRATFCAHPRESGMKRSTLVTLAVIAVVIALFFYMSTARANTECNVCMDFQGRSNCATAAGRNEHEATQTAQSTACGPIANGMNETIAGGDPPPLDVQCRTRGSRNAAAGSRARCAGTLPRRSHRPP